MLGSVSLTLLENVLDVEVPRIRPQFALVK